MDQLINMTTTSQKPITTMTIQSLIALNNGKKFDVCLMNPPYGAHKSGNVDIHFKFVEKCLEIVKKMEVIMPFRMYQSSNTKYDYYKDIFKKSLTTVEEVDSSIFSDTHMDMVGIYDFNLNKENDTEPKIIYTSNINKRFNFSDYEKEIFEYCKVDKPNFTPFRPLGKDKKENLSEFCDIFINKRWPNNDKVFLITNLANGKMNAIFISKAVGQICKNNKELKDLMIQRKGACCTFMSFDSIKEAENCRIALQNPLLRFGLYKLQDDQSMTARVYKYIPNIDWSNSKCTTDEGLLELCGCPKDKAKEYAEYCKKIIEEVDKK